MTAPRATILPPDVAQHLAEQVVSLAATLDAIGSRQAASARDHAGQGLLTVLAFLRETAIGGRAVQSLQALSNELHALETTGRHGVMLTGEKANGRPADAPEVESLKGRVAALLQLRHDRAGGARVASAKWLARKLPSQLAHKLAPSKGGVTGRAVMDWHDKFSTAAGTGTTAGRNGYVAMLALSKQLSPGKPLTDPALLRVIGGLAGQYPENPPA